MNYSEIVYYAHQTFLENMQKLQNLYKILIHQNGPKSLIMAFGSFLVSILVPSF